MGHQELAQKEGFEVVRQLPAISSKAVYLAKKEGAFYILKWPEVAWDERQALRVWSGNAGPLFYDLHPDFFALQYLSGRNPYYWSEEDFPKLIRLLQKMQEYQPANPEDFRPLDDLVEKIEEKILASPLPQRKQAASALLEAAKAAEGQMLIHGDLHPWNILDRKSVV